MTKSRQAASRVPSLPFLRTLWSAHKADTASVVSSGMAKDEVFYDLNPDKNLVETQKRLQGDLMIMRPQGLGEMGGRGAQEAATGGRTAGEGRLPVLRTRQRQQVPVRGRDREGRIVLRLRGSII